MYFWGWFFWFWFCFLSTSCLQCFDTWLGGRNGIRPVKNMGGMVEVQAVFLPLLISPCTMKSRSSLLAPAHPGVPGKRAVKRLWWWWFLSTSQEIGWEEHLRNDLFGVEWGVKPSINWFHQRKSLRIISWFLQAGCLSFPHLQPSVGIWDVRIRSIHFQARCHARQPPYKATKPGSCQCLLCTIVTSVYWCMSPFVGPRVGSGAISK